MINAIYDKNGDPDERLFKCHRPEKTTVVCVWETRKENGKHVSFFFNAGEKCGFFHDLSLSVSSILQPV